MDSSAGRVSTAAPRGITAIGIFLLFGTLMAALAGATLAWPGTALDRMWDLNPRAYDQLAPLGRTVGILFMLLGLALAVAALGWFKRCLWGWRLAVALVTTHVLGDLVNVFVGRIIEGGIGATIAGALLFYLLRAPMRAAFEHRGSQYDAR